MSFATFPAALPYFASLHDQALLDEEVDALSARVAHGDKEKAEALASQPFMDAIRMVEKLTVTENGAVALSTSSDPCVDLYASMTGNHCAASDLAAAYQHDAETTLKLIFHCRSIHEGKANKMGFYSAFFWLLKHHPKTALENLSVLVKGTIPCRFVDKNKRTEGDSNDNDGDVDGSGNDDNEGKQDADADEDWEVVDKDDKPEAPVFYKSHGYWKDLLNILSIYATEGLDASEFTVLNCPREERKPKDQWRAKLKERRDFYKSLQSYPQDKVDRLRKERAEKVQLRAIREQERQTELRRKKRAERHRHVVKLLKKDATYRALHFTVARLFATQLEQDQEIVRTHESSGDEGGQDRYALANKLSLCAKWAPTLAASHDKHTNIATSIAELLFMKDATLDDTQRLYRLNAARDQYRSQILTPLRKIMEITERSMSLNEWNRINFSHVPSICMQNNSKHFLKHVPNEYQAFLKAVSEGTRKVSGAVLGPHDFVRRAFDCMYKETDDPAVMAERQLLDGQWSSYIRALQTSCDAGHALRSSMAICDVSGSMSYGENGVQPLHAAIGLSLTLLALASEPFTGVMISFSENPSAFSVDTCAPFVDQVKHVMECEWGYSTDLHAVFTRLLLPMAQKYKIKQEDMVKRLFVFTDMQFNSVNGDQFDTLWETIVKDYAEAGYVPPEVVWWNLCARGQSELTLQASSDTKGVAMVAGFSQNMLKNFMEGDQLASEIVPPSRWELQEQEEKLKEQMTPLQVMMKDISKDSFSSLKVYD